MTRPSVSRWLCAVTCLFGITMVSSIQAQVIWANPWTYQSTLQFDVPDHGATFKADGGAIVSSLSSHLQLLQIGPNGEKHWDASLYAYASGGFDYSFSRPGPHLPLENNGAVISVPSDYHSYQFLTHLDGSGNILWSREAAASWLVRYGNNQIAYAGCNSLTLADLASGNVLWQRSFQLSANCAPMSGALDASGNIVAEFPLHAGNSDGYRLAKFQANGTELWSVIDATAGDSSIVGIGGTTLYLQTPTELIALDANNGSEIWSAAISEDARFVLSADAPIEPIMLVADTSGSIARFIAANGDIRWSVPTGDCPFCLPAFTAPGSFVYSSRQDVTRIDSSTGAQVWSTHLPQTDTQGSPLYWYEFGGLANNRFLGVCGAKTVGIHARFLPVDFASGTLLPELLSPSMDYGAMGMSAADGDDVFDVAQGATESVDPIRLRRADASTGVMAWENVETVLPAPLADLGYRQDSKGAMLAVGTDEVATSTTWSRPGSVTFGSFELGQVSAHERTTGAQRWSVVLGDAVQGMTDISSPAFDSVGNVFVTMTAYRPCGFVGEYCGFQALYKLAGDTGNILWHLESGDYSPYTPPFPQIHTLPLEVFNDDIVIKDRFPGASHALARLSGVDGSRVWSTDVFSGGSSDLYFYRQDAGHIIASAQGQSARVDLPTGATLWTASFMEPACQQSCYQYAQLVLANGDRLLVGEGDSKPRILREHNDGSGTLESWTLEPNDPQLRSLVHSAGATPSGSVKLVMSRIDRKTPGAISILAGFDPVTGNLNSQQVITLRPMDTTSESLGKDLLAFPAENRMLFRARDLGEAHAYSNGSGLLDTTITAHGDFTLAITADTDPVQIGQSVGFQIVATYNGDQAISGAKLNVGTHVRQGGLSNLGCSTQSASNCVLDDRSGNVHASFDIQPGGSIEINGQMRIVENRADDYFGGVVAGPTSLSEPDTLNNFSRVKIVRSLFTDGFD